MKYDVHLNTGAVIPIELPETWDPAGLLRGGWLVSDAGTMIRANAVVAMIPVTASVPDAELPERMYDGEGGLWTRNDAGTYDYRGSDGNDLTYPLARIAREFGLLAETDGGF